MGTFNPEQDAAGPGGHTLNRSFGYHETGTLQEQGKFSREGEVARAFTILGNTMTALDYYRQLVDPSRLPQINIVLTDPFLVDEDNYSFYSPNKTHMIYITPDSEWSFWAVAHETSHYFDGGILVTGSLDNYGSWGEPMANVRAGMIIGSSWMAPREGVKAENLDVQGNWDRGGLGASCGTCATRDPKRPSHWTSASASSTSGTAAAHPPNPATIC